MSATLTVRQPEGRQTKGTLKMKKDETNLKEYRFNFYFTSDQEFHPQPGDFDYEENPKPELALVKVKAVSAKFAEEKALEYVKTMPWADQVIRWNLKR